MDRFMIFHNYECNCLYQMVVWEAWGLSMAFCSECSECSCLILSLQNGGVGGLGPVYGIL